MKIHTIWIQYKQSYPGELMPNVHDAWDEFSQADNPEGYAKAFATAKEMENDDAHGVEAVREIIVDVDENAVLKAFEPRVVKGGVA